MAGGKNLTVKKTLLEPEQISRIIRRMAGELMERNQGFEEMMLVGIRTRGVPLAERLATEIEAMEGQKVPMGILDITLYRDDLSTIAPNPQVKETLFPEAVDGKILVLCDDVLYTGRTIRAALDALVDFGRPQGVQLAVLVDRGRRELPIQADFVGVEVPTSRTEVIQVTFPETDGGEYFVRLLDRESEE